MSDVGLLAYVAAENLNTIRNVLASWMLQVAVRPPDECYTRRCRGLRYGSLYRWMLPLTPRSIPETCLVDNILVLIVSKSVRIEIRSPGKVDKSR